MLKQPMSWFVIAAGRLFKYSLLLLLGFLFALILAHAIGPQSIGMVILMSLGPWVFGGLVVMGLLMFLCVVAESLR